MCLKIDYLKINKFTLTQLLFIACLVSYATETVMQYCHGKRSCDLVADIATFGSTCRSESRMYLKVVYTCGTYFSCSIKRDNVKCLLRYFKLFQPICLYSNSH